MLDLAVNLLGPDLHPVTVALRDLGARHTAYGVLPSHYDIVGQALLHTLETALGDAWTDEVKKGWIGVYTFVSTAMIEGAEEYLKEQVLKERMEQKLQGENTDSEEAVPAAEARAVQAAKKKLAQSKETNSLAAKNQLPVVKRSRKSLSSVLLSRSTAVDDGQKKKKVPNSQIQDRGLITWLDKALRITRQ
jgi:hypothetical protein